MPVTFSDPKCIEQSIVVAYQFSLVASAHIPDDISSLLLQAYSEHFDEYMPTFPDMAGPIADSPEESRRHLLSLLAKIPALHRSGQECIDCARSILAELPQPRKSVEPVENESIPLALHTLLQGTLWAVMMAGGANPDLAVDDENDVSSEYSEDWSDISHSNADYGHGHDDPASTDQRDIPTPEPADVQVDGAVTEPSTYEEAVFRLPLPDTRPWWFLCKQVFQSLEAAEAEGDVLLTEDEQLCVCRTFRQRSFIHLADEADPVFYFLRVPPVDRVFSVTGMTFIIVTLAGTYGVGANEVDELGMTGDFIPNPTRLTFPACPMVAEHEASLPPWEKHRLVATVALSEYCTFILTPVCLIVAGADIQWYTGPVEDDCVFNPVPIPLNSKIESIVSRDFLLMLSILRMSSKGHPHHRILISGDNEHGQLALGHQNEMTGLVMLPFRAQTVIAQAEFNVFVTSRHVMFSGLVPEFIERSGFLPGHPAGTVCSTATPLTFPVQIRGFMCYGEYMCLITDAETTLCIERGTQRYTLPFEAIAASFTTGRFFRNMSGGWFVIVGVEDGEPLLEPCRRPPFACAVVPVVTEAG
ncbi:hypothetical protein J8273_2921 [Carpediemonas membranifera]|uniref:Uncharacterized protein n=1 Tax=Carpediemonas membranifera TaxID=201153 RepID=A0A8J6E313_9EUKA|nr:hypothetical protein J8273_2921 [Carpediemonas membranifera]|eukprot:KAG9395363.1 hypothetical protein J8273_2921 [Carpediemonas membranifera]